MYLVVSIGNSDDKLTQKEWNRFVEDVIDTLGEAGKVHFFGGASTFAPWQNVAWVVEIEPKNVDAAVNKIIGIRKRYSQDSAFVMIGEGLFV